MELKDLIPVLQLALGPVILISGVGMLILTMTNRLGRTIDRSRQLVDLRRQAESENRIRLELQLGILWRRARLLRASITFAGLTVLLDALMMITLFVGALTTWRVAIAVAVVFALSLLSLIASIVLFLRDINLALRALGHELDVAAQLK